MSGTGSASAAVSGARSGSYSVSAPPGAQISVPESVFRATFRDHGRAGVLAEGLANGYRRVSIQSGSHTSALSARELPWSR